MQLTLFALEQKTMFFPHRWSDDDFLNWFLNLPKLWDPPPSRVTGLLEPKQAECTLDKSLVQRDNFFFKVCLFRSAEGFQLNPEEWTVKLKWCSWWSTDSKQTAAMKGQILEPLKHLFDIFTDCKVSSGQKSRIDSYWDTTSKAVVKKGGRVREWTM